MNADLFNRMNDIIKYGELSTKKDNKNFFIKKRIYFYKKKSVKYYYNSCFFLRFLIYLMSRGVIAKW